MDNYHWHIKFLYFHRHIFGVFIVFLPTIMFTHQVHAINRTKFPIQIQLNLGELPHNAFAPGINAGYHFTEWIYLGYILQFPFDIGGDDHSINAQAPGFNGLVRSERELGIRQALLVRISPFKLGAFFSFGVLATNVDKEQLVFDKRVRTIGNNTYDTAVEIELERPNEVRPAAGLGFNQVFSNGISLTADIFFALGSIAEPRIAIRSDSPIADSDAEQLKRIISENYTDNIHNRFHLVQIGMGYNF